MLSCVIRLGFVGLCGANTLSKTVSTTFFLYFACILPSIALGVLNYNNTGGMIGTLLLYPVFMLMISNNEPSIVTESFEHNKSIEDIFTTGLASTQRLSSTITVKGKVFPYSLPSVGPGADPGVQAVSP